MSTREEEAKSKWHRDKRLELPPDFPPFVSLLLVVEGFPAATSTSVLPCLALPLPSHDPAPAPGGSLVGSQLPESEQDQRFDH